MSGRAAKPRAAILRAARPRATVVLIGMRGVGKSTVGRALAARLGLSFVDLDRRIERDAGATVARIFREQGETRFRALETEALRAEALRGEALRGEAMRAAAPGSRGFVLATGGGIVERRENDAHLRGLGTIVWLQADLATIRARVASSRGRPALLGADPARELRRLAARRAPRYRALADLVVRCGGATPKVLAERIARRVSSLPS